MLTARDIEFLEALAELRAALLDFRSAYLRSRQRKLLERQQPQVARVYFNLQAAAIEVARQFYEKHTDLRM